MSKPFLSSLGVLLSCCLLLPVAPAPVNAAEIYSNGTGGGDWADASTWRGGVVPGPNDVAVVAREDEVIFARNDSEQTTCLELHLDPRGVLRFKPRAGKVVMQVAGPVVSYGAIRMDGAQSAQDEMGFHLIAEKPEERKITIKEEGLFAATGWPDLPEGRRNVTLRAGAPLTDQNQAGGDGGVLAAGDGCGLDVRHVHVDNLRLAGNEIDNTGAEFNERLVIEHNRFTRDALVTLVHCDTPTITNNVFRKPEGGWVQPAAIHLHACPLAEVRDNDIEGMYYHGIQGNHSADGAVLRNRITKAYIGLVWTHGNLMAQALQISGARHGISFSHGGGAIDGLLTRNCMLPLIKGNGVLQVSNWIDDGERSKHQVSVTQGRLELLNTNIQPEQVKVDANAALPESETEGALVRSRYFLLAAVAGDPPPGAQIVVERKDWQPPRPGAQDPNVTNSPAPLSRMRLTPLPATMRSLIVTAWQYDLQRQLVPAPAYRVRLVKSADDPTVLREVEVTPNDQWFRAAPNEPQPTVELQP